MRRSLIVTVAATTVIVLVALLVPMALLVGRYALEDRLARAALEVQATETVVSGQDKGFVSGYVTRLNATDDGVRTTVLYPDGAGVGPDPGEDRRSRQARRTGQARLDDVEGGTQMLVPVSLGGSSALPADTPVVRVLVLERGIAGDVRRSWALLAVLGAALLVGSLVVADRLGRSFVEPVRALAATARRLSTGDRSRPLTSDGPREVGDVASALQQLVTRVDVLVERERATVADLSHRLRTPVTRLRLGLDRLAPADRRRLEGHVDELDRMVDEVVREARRTEREGLTAHADAGDAVRRRTDFWRPLAEDQGRLLTVTAPVAALPVRASATDLDVLLDTLLDNTFSYTDEGVALAVTLTDDGGWARLVVDDEGPGFPPDSDPLRRGESHAGSTGLGLDIVRRTAEAAGGHVEVTAAPTGGARVVVVLGRADGGLPSTLVSD